MNKELIKQLQPTLVTLAKHLLADLKTGEVYLVGGAVRDLILERTTKDYDLVVRGINIKTLEHWLAEHGKVNFVGKTFGVFKWQPAGWAGEMIDVALPRTEHVQVGTGQYRDFAIQSNSTLPIEDDLIRRDFTINAMALNLTTGKLVDPSGGETDLKKKIIRTVGEPKLRFNEDLSRTLRGLRFACQLGFTIEKNTWQAIKNLSAKTASGKLKNDWLVPREIIARELLKSFKNNPIKALEILDDSDFLDELLPEVTLMKGVPQPPEFHSEGDVFEHTKLALAALNSPAWNKFFSDAKPNLNTILTVLLHDIGKPLTLKTPEKHGVNRIRTDGHDTAGAKLIPEICNKLKLTSYTDPEAGQINIDNVTWLVEKHLLLAHGKPSVLKPSTIYRYFWKDAQLGLELQQVLFADLYSTKPTDGRQLTDNLILLQQRITEVGQKLQQGKLELFMSGTDIMKKFKLGSGPKIGKLLSELEKAQLENKVHNISEAEKYLKNKLKMQRSK
jgi:poly(A) polymerase